MGWEEKKSKKYYDKYTHMLTISINNYFDNKFVPAYHIDINFINGYGRKLMTRHIYHTFYTFEKLNFVVSSFKDRAN